MIDLIVSLGMKAFRFIMNLFSDLIESGKQEVDELKAMVNDVKPSTIAKDLTSEGIRFFGSALALEGLRKYPTHFLTKAKPFVTLPYEDCINGTEVRPLLLTWRLSQQLFYKYAYNIDYVRTSFSLGM